MTADEDALRALGVQADSASDDSDSPSEAVPIPEPPEADSQPAPEKEEPERSGSEVEKPAIDPKPEEKAAELTPYQQAVAAKKDREAKAWQRIESEKEAIARQKFELAQEQQRIAAARQESEALQPSRDNLGFTAADYERESARFKQDGDEALAKAALQQAGMLRQHEQQRAQQVHTQKVMASIHEVVKERPEFANPNGPDGLGVQQVIAQHPQLGQTVGGFRTAVAIYDARKTATSLPDLQAKIAKLTEENTRLNRLTTLPSGQPRRPAAAEKKLEDLPPAEQEKRLRAMASRHDNSNDY